jgi:hypothetical protein
MPSKRRNYTELWRFAYICIKTERRSRLSGIWLFTMADILKVKYRSELEGLLPKKAGSKLSGAEDIRFNWLVQVFNLKELTDIVKKYTYEQYKNSRSL